MPPSPPGPFFQHLNAISHREPLATALHLLVFLPFLALATPVGIVGILLYGAFRVYISRCLPAMVPAKHLGVVITGCDSGFGRELALAAADAGYTVFAGCLTPTASWPGPVSPRLMPLLMDVTNDGQVQEAVRAVETWLAADDSRILHALVNNAGVGGIGLIDWMDMTFYEVCMNGACPMIVERERIILCFIFRIARCAILPNLSQQCTV
jgi:short chain dehydrogenase